MNRQQRRHIERELKRLAKRDLCSFCDERFPHNSRTFFGVCRGRMALACEHCADNIEEIHSVGVVTTRAYDFLPKADPEAAYSTDEVVDGVAALQQAISYADQAIGDAERRGGALQQRGSIYWIIRGKKMTASGSSSIPSARTACGFPILTKMARS